MNGEQPSISSSVCREPAYVGMDAKKNKQNKKTPSLSHGGDFT